MIIYSKQIETESFKELCALLTKCKISEDIINNVIAGNIKVKNKEAYDRIYNDLIRDTILFETRLDKVKEEVMGTNILYNGVYFHMFSSRCKLIVSLDEHMSNSDKTDIENFLLKKGFIKDEIK